MARGGGRGRYYRGRGRRRGGGGRVGSREGQEDDAVDDDPEEVRLARLKGYYINLFIDKARLLYLQGRIATHLRDDSEGEAVLETGCTNGEKYELAARSERCLMRGIQPSSTGCGKANTMAAAPVIKALTEALDELPPAMGARIAVLACVCLLEKGSSALACSTIMQAVRASRCLSSLLSTCPPSSSEEASVPQSSLLCPDSRSITVFLDISLTAIFEGRTRPRTPKLLVSFLESIAPTIPFLTSLEAPSSSIFVLRLLNGGAGDIKVGGALGAYLRGPKLLHYSIFRQVLLSASSHDVALEVLKRCEEVHGREHLRPLGLAEGLLQVLLSFGHYKMAYLASRELGLSQTYPFVERLFREDRIKKMVAKNKWQFAQAMIHGLQERVKRKEEEEKAAKALRQAVAAARGEVLITEEDEKEEEMENEVRKGEVRHLCACLVRALMSKPGQLSRAAALRKVYGLEDMIEEPDAQALAAEAEARAALYLELPIPLVKVLMVDSIETLDRAREVLGRLVPRAEESWKEGRPEVIGLDVEWRPGLYQYYDDKNAKKEVTSINKATAAEGDIEVDTDVVVVEGGGGEEDINKPAADNREIAREGGVNLLVIEEGGGGGEEGTSKQAHAANNKEIASLLQIASRDEVLIMDLWALCGRDARLLEQFNACLTLVFQDSQLLKLGFGFSSDMQVLQNAWPEVSAFRSIRGALDIADIGLPSPSTTITSTSAADGHSMLCGSHRLRPRSLTGFCKEWLGKELDKGEQVSDWDLRPLTTEQVRYAALDAWVLTSIFDQKLNEQAAVDSGPSDQRGRPFWTRLTVDLGRGGNRVETGWFEGDEDGSSRSPPSVEEVINRAKEAGLLSGQPITFHNEEEALETVVVNGGEGDQAKEEEGAAGVASMTTTRKNMKWMRTKSVALMVDQKLMASTSASSSAATAPVLVLAPEKSRVQIARVATALGLPRRALRLAYPQECRKVLGYAPGFIPPIAHRVRTRLVLDQSLHLTDTSQPMRLICGAGTSGRVFTCLSQDLLALGGPASMAVAVCHISSLPRPVELLQLKIGEEEGGGSSSTESGGREEQEAAAVDDGRNGPQVVAAIEDDLHDRPQLAFLLDGMLGRLCKWMRVVGIDVEFFESRPAKGGTLQALKAPNPPSIIAQAHRTNRIIITKDRKLINSRWYSTLNVMSYLVRGEDVREQLEDIVRYFNIRCKEDDIMSRCSVCNSKGYKELSRVEVEKRGDVPPKVLAHVSTFWECLNPCCLKLFWEGPKFDSAKAKFDLLIAELGEMVDGGEQGGESRAMLGDEEEEVEEGDGGDEPVGHYRPLTVIMREDRKVFEEEEEEEEEEENGADEGETERHRPLIVNSKELMEVEKTLKERGVSREEEEDGGEEWKNYQALAAAVRKEDGKAEERGEGEEWEKYRPMTRMMKEDRKVVEEEEEEEEEEVGREEWEQYQPLAVIAKEGNEEPEEEEEEVEGEWGKYQLMTLMMKEDRKVEEREDVEEGEAEGLKAEDVGLCDVGGTTSTMLKENSLEVHQNEGIAFIEEGKGEEERHSVYTLPSAERKNGWMEQQGCVVQ